MLVCLPALPAQHILTLGTLPPSFLPLLSLVGQNAALAYARAHFPPFQHTHLGQIQRLMGALCFAGRGAGAEGSLLQQVCLSVCALPRDVLSAMRGPLRRCSPLPSRPQSLNHQYIHSSARQLPPVAITYAYPFLPWLPAGGRQAAGPAQLGPLCGPVQPGGAVGRGGQGLCAAELRAAGPGGW